MELLLKRDGETGYVWDTLRPVCQTRTESGGACPLSARPSLTKPIIMEDEYGRNNFRWRLMLIPAGFAALIVGVIVVVCY